MTQAIIFDMYGVLALNGWQAFKAYHFSDREDVWTEVFEIGKRVDAGLTDYAELISFTAEKTGESEATVRHQLEDTVANQALLDYIASELKPRYKIGLLSNAGTTQVYDDVFTVEQRALFDSITFSHNVGLVKPDIRMFEASAERLGVDIKGCVMVDDQERHLAGAKDAGMHPVLYRDLEQFKNDLEKAVHAND
jgi:HAD superfamily hydrolase (TIGR01509 family)